MQALSQLSYGPTGWKREILVSNPGNVNTFENKKSHACFACRGQRRHAVALPRQEV